MKIGTAFIKKDEKNDETAFIVQYDNKFDLIKTTKESIFIKTKENKYKINDPKRFPV